jgi:hypothetical protein
MNDLILAQTLMVCIWVPIAAIVILVAWAPCRRWTRAIDRRWRRDAILRDAARYGRYASIRENQRVLR